uniref:Uncharacterized protein n=1 Tax=Solanum tuberosum TaxID=4113 RepID=M1D892_SOLTU
MAKMMTQLDILAKNVIGFGARGVNVVGVGEMHPNEAKFEVLYNEEVNFLANQGVGYRTNYPRPSGNQGWNRDKGWQDCDRERRDRNASWKEREGDKDRPMAESVTHRTGLQARLCPPFGPPYWTRDIARTNLDDSGMPPCK